MSKFITIRLESIPPSTNALYKGRQKYGKSGRTWTDEYKLWSQLAGVEIMAQRQQWPFQTIDGMFAAMAVWPYNGKRDLDNYWKSLFDMLQKMGVIKNDKHCVMQIGYKSKLQKDYGIIVLKPVSMDEIHADIARHGMGA